MRITSIIVMVGLIIAASITATGAFFIGTYASNYNQAVLLEQNIKSQSKYREEVLESTVNDVIKITGVESEAVLRLREVIRGNFNEARPRVVSGTTWQWIREEYPDIDSGLRDVFQDAIEVGMTEYRISSKRLEDYRDLYLDKLDSSAPIIGTGWWMKLAGFPRIEISAQQETANDARQDRQDG